MIHPAEARHRAERVGVTAAALAAVGFGTAYPVTAFVLRTFEPLAASAVQASIATLFVASLVVVGIMPRPSPAARTRQGLVRLAILGTLGGVCFIVGMNVAVQLAGATIAGFVATLYAVFAALLAVPILGERLTVTTVGAFVLALVGAALLADLSSMDPSLMGVLFALGGAVTYALYLVLARHWGAATGLDPTSMALALLITRGPLLVLVELVRDPSSLTPAGIDAATVLAVLFLAVVPSGTSQVLVLVSTRRVASRRTSAWLLLTPITSAVIAALLLGESLAPIELVGCMLVIVGILGAGVGSRGIRQLGAAISRRGKTSQA